MKHPVLKIRKNAERDPDLHYDREKRLSMPGAPRGPRPSAGFIRTFFKRGRVSVFPILLLAVAVVVFLRVYPRASDRAAISGWEAVLQASPYEDALLASVTFRRTHAENADSGASAPTASVRFLLPETSEGAFVSETILGEDAVLRSRLRYRGGERTLEADVQVGESRKKLVLSLRSR